MVFRKINIISKPILTLTLGTGISQAIPLLFSPLLTRLYSPREFGSFALYFSIITILSSFSTGKYEQALAITKNKSEANQVLSLCFLISTFFSALVLLFVISLNHYQFTFFEISILEEGIFLIPFGLLVSSWFQSLSYYLNKDGLYKEMSLSRILRSSFYVIFAITLSQLEKNYVLVVAEVIAYLIVVIYLVYIIRKSDYQLPRLSNIHGVALQYIGFPKFSILSGFVEKVSSQSPTFYFNNVLKNSEALGAFGFTYRIVAAPIDLLSKSIGDVFRKNASDEYLQTGQAKLVFTANLKRLTILSGITFIPAFFIVEDFFVLLFGENWSIAGYYAKLMIPLFALQLIVSPLSTMFFIAQKQSLDLFLQLFLFILLSTSFLLSFLYFKTIESAIIAYTLAYSIKYIIELILSYDFAKGDERAVKK
ncbi:MAG: oligosaccharide flippase family protein [Cyclobacteriaceae bacterium]|jgi:O-antigen/teichoic acid export membrane protein|nr:oligosaccharide flippase family protein [Cytophagales bacterium]MCZ8329037.1 oligosaccharide flippase family protein [Cyclobacteriaceae bacterium]